jgi:hypothetical protein
MPAADAPGKVGFADLVAHMPRHVASTTLEATEWVNSHLIKSDAVGEISRLKQQPGRTSWLPVITL